MQRNGGQGQIGQQGRSTALAKDEAPPGPIDVFKDRLVRRKGEIELLTPRRVRREFPPQRVIVVAVQGYRTMMQNLGRNAPLPDIDSTIDAVLRMAQLGLEAGTEQAYLVPYNGKVQPIVGPRGLIDISLRNPRMRTCVARCVLTGDAFDYDLGTSTITHKKGRHPIAQTERAAAVEFAWARYVTAGGGDEIEVLTREDIEFYRTFSPSKKSGPWFDNYEGMARKTALKRLLAYAPRDTFLSLAFCEDDSGSYSPGLSLDETRDAIDASEVITAQVPASLPPRQTVSAEEQSRDQQQPEAGAVPQRASFGDPAEDYPRT